ncbi:UNVERIFIED_CONTAM: zinc finger protein [Trichonephila clavipes]
MTSDSNSIRTLNHLTQHLFLLSTTSPENILKTFKPIGDKDVNTNHILNKSTGPIFFTIFVFTSVKKTCTCGTSKMAFTQGNSRYPLHVQGNEKLYVCEMCNKGFSQISDLKVHLLCNKGFSQTHHLKIHLRTHTKEKPYVCEMCNKGFSLNKELKVHLRTHTKEKPYVCEVCYKGFARNEVLKRHLRIHTKKETLSM